MDKYNLVVIGAGSGGLVSAYVAAFTKAKVALIEKHKMGGDCLNTGCVPSKALIHAAKMAYHSKKAIDLGISNQTTIDFSKVMKSVREAQRQIESHDSRERYSGLGVTCLQGTAKILSPHTVEVNGNILHTKNIIVATGSSPFIPPFVGLNEVPYYTSDTIWNIEKLPENLLVIGGGTIGVELAQSFLRLGSKVILLERNPRILSREDVDTSETVAAQLQSEGMQIFTQSQVESFRRVGTKGLALVKLRGAETKEIAFDACLIALGRKANAFSLGLDIKLNSRACIETDSLLRTNFKNIFAVGDVAGPFQFTHMASYQAGIATINALFRPFARLKVDYRIVPAVTFCDPELARVGLTAQEAKEAGLKFDETIYEFKELDRAIITRDTKGFVKVITQTGSDKILGVCIVGPQAGELIIPFVFAMQRGLGLKAIFSLRYPYPILSEANRFVAGEWQKRGFSSWKAKALQIWHEWQRS